MPGRHYGLRIQEECIDAVVGLTIQFPAAPLEHIFRMVAVAVGLDPAADWPLAEFFTPLSEAGMKNGCCF